MQEGRSARRTTETDITVTWQLDGEGKAEIQTGIGFLDHMLTLLTRHGGFNLAVQATGDREVDDHHLTEDTGIGLGDALREALGDRAGINRYGFASIPMDEALAQVSLDCSGRPGLVFNVILRAVKVGSFDTELVEEFLRALANHAGLTIHVNVPYGRNTHHILEAVFKALGHALRQAVQRSDRGGAVLSTKGVL